MRFIPWVVVASAGVLLGAAGGPSLDPKDVRVVGAATLSSVSYLGEPALSVVSADPPGTAPEKLIVLPGPAFHDGTVDLKVAGEPSATANPGARGFVGIMVRLSPDDRTGEVFYVRPTNGRADDQERRNHAVQYVSPPDWPWERLRRETPSRYESYADMEPGQWIRLRLEVTGAKARLYVGDARQPTLVVNDLKRGADASGAVALWVGPGTIAHFADVTIAPR